MKKLLMLFGATLLSAAAMAQDAEATKPKDSGTMMKSAATFESLDKNQDQQISKTEAAGDRRLSDSFASLDTNGDGYVSKAEYAARTRS
jgi:Ca2+-binding EF-hand superfamily protein